MALACSHVWTRRTGSRERVKRPKNIQRRAGKYWKTMENHVGSGWTGRNERKPDCASLAWEQETRDESGPGLLGRHDVVVLESFSFFVILFRSLCCILMRFVLMHFESFWCILMPFQSFSILLHPFQSFSFLFIHVHAFSRLHGSFFRKCLHAVSDFVVLCDSTKRLLL